MLYRIQNDDETGYLERHNATTLQSLSSHYKEADLQRWIFHHLDSVLRTDELLPIQQATRGEEADITAVDASGRLFIFELKRWEAHSENLLQVMRYAQISSQWGYEHLNKLYQKLNKSEGQLSEVHQEVFGFSNPLERAAWNHDQVLVVITNGLDYTTRKAIKYWNSKGINIRAWIYRVYEINGQPFLDINAFGQEDDPHEDRPMRYHLVNTNYSNDPISHHYMLNEGRAAAFYTPWKNKVDNIEKGDWVFLYYSGHWVVAYGKCQSETPSLKAPPHAPEDHHQEHFVTLSPFYRLEHSVSPSELRDAAGYHVPLVSTYTQLRTTGGDSLKSHCDRYRQADSLSM
ncbi:hypothetical protein [Halovibrio sp. HP20-50]|uniref:hypothetical protein n=1 Tax=Halovibrio sp. HP20-59 TaxID=3080275 RepID=UPI00294B5143|nr:hypothetical protein [Halovibrio sp. HP20-59]MEA2117564.1 hypothetical protein [Halovibrio sp. HP20-59]